MKRFTKQLSALTTAAMLAGLIAGCSGGSKNGQEGQVPAGESASPAASPEQREGEVYPIPGNVKLRYWMPLPANTAAVAQNLAQTELAKEWSRRTGVEVEFIHPTSGQEKEQFNLLIASNNYPDIIYTDWKNYPGGPDKAISDKVIVSLNELQEKYAPNLSKFLKENQDIDRSVKTAEGSYYSFPFIRGSQELLVSAGPIIRKDWLDELGLEVPETIEEWHVALTAFKEEKGAAAPFSPYHNFQVNAVPWGLFVGAYGITKGFYVEDDKIKYGSIESQYKEFLTTMNQWFNEKLLDNNFASLDGKTVDASIMEGKTGATIASGGSGLARWMTAMEGKGTFELAGAPYPVLNKGERSKFGQYTMPYVGAGAAISATSKNKEVAAQFLDYLYSEEGHMLANFGLEGVSYEMKDGKGVFTDFVMKNPSNPSSSQMRAQYTLAHDQGPFIQDPGVLQTMTEAQAEAVKRWSDTDIADHFVPPIFLQAEEQSEAAKIMNDVSTYEDEMMLKFIMGSEPISNFDKYVEQMKKLGIEKVIKMNQDALDRYNEN